LVVAASVGLGCGCGGRLTASEPGGGSGGINLGAGGNPQAGGAVGGSAIFVDASTGGSGLQVCDISRTLPNCMASPRAATMRTPNVVVVLDKSGSMGKPGLGSTTSKWDATKVALSAALNRARLTINFGLDLFPRADVTSACTGEACCQTAALADPPAVPVGPGTDTVPQIAAALNATAPSGGTPMAAALSRALDYYTTGDGRNLVGDKYVLLVTDGGPNCDTAAVPVCDAVHCTRNLDPDPNCNQATNCCSTSALAVNCLDDVSVNTEIQLLAQSGIPTIVVGIPGSDPYVEYLNQFAQTGGMPQPGGSTAYYAVAESAGASGLADTVSSILADLVRACVITYSMPPDDPELVNVLVDCTLVPREPTIGDASYWTLDLTAMTITLGGPICGHILNGDVNRVDYVLGCPRPPG
jgi:hypothetical protein